MLISFPQHVSTLAELTTKMAASGTNLTYFKYTGEAVISHYYTTTTTAAYGSTVTVYAFLQDNTSGIALKDNNKNLTSDYKSGDKISGIIAQVYNVNNVPQLYPYTDFSILSSGNVIVPETVASIAEAKTKPSQLVRINSLSFNGADGTKTFGVNNSVFFVENSIVTDFPLRIPSNLTVAPDYQGNVIPTTAVDILGIISKVETSFTNFSLFVRKASELNLKETAVKEPKVLNLSIYDNVISFETLFPRLVEIYNPNGQLVKSFVSIIGENRVELEKGVFIIRIGDETAKILL